MALICLIYVVVLLMPSQHLTSCRNLEGRALKTLPDLPLSLTKWSFLKAVHCPTEWFLQNQSIQQAADQVSFDLLVLSPWRSGNAYATPYASLRRQFQLTCKELTPIRRHTHTRLLLRRGPYCHSLTKSCLCKCLKRAYYATMFCLRHSTFLA